MRVVTAEELAARTCDSTDSHSQLWIAIDGQVYDVTAWSTQHPGGALVLRHCSGKDATMAFEAYHPQHVQSRLRHYVIGRLAHDSSLPDAVAAHDKDAMSAALEDSELRKLRKELEASGLFDYNPWFYVRQAICCVVLFTAAVAAAAQQRVAIAAALIALFWQQVAFVGHDAGHNALTGQRRIDGAIGCVVQACVGIGFSWWKATHNVHHTCVNSADCDPDIQFMPLIAPSSSFFASLRSRYHNDDMPFDATAQRLVSIQHLTFLPLMTIARYGMYLQAVLHLCRGMIFVNVAAEVAAIVIYFVWYGWLVSKLDGTGARLAFVVMSHAFFGVLHLQICLSHFSRHIYTGTPQPSMSWLRLQLSGTMNWRCPRWLDWFHGGLQFQIEHHLFPRMPRQNLRRTAPHVRALCRRFSIPYHDPGFFEAIWETLLALRNTARLAKACHCTS